ncbi:hypothetical protein E4U42_003785 [Claviceps africana]|uniref:Uncharacterized protein n=1 Tax=Claviceps africana TaxID=83212 RepID=A0A8K0J7B2_9HYPO|nr:hypothetical protein E4U42_003785 [Claviceps africana]
MDRPNEGQASSQAMSRTEYSRNVRAAVEERRHKAMLNRQQYQPQIHEQIQRLFPEYDAPFYARLRGFGRTQTLALAESTVLGLAVGTDRNLSDTETQALTEHFLSSIHNMLAWKWIMTGLAGYMTYRGRKTMRFPFFKPVAGDGRFDPFSGGPQVRIMWHTARFAGYYGAFWLIGDPVFQSLNFFRQGYALDRDPRLAPLLREGRKKAADQAFGAGTQDALGEQQQQDYSQSGDDHQSTSQAVRAQTQQTWASYRRQPEASQQAASNGWDAVDDVDDASPIAASARTQPESPRTYGGSAWDRVRQQTQSPQGPVGVQNRRTWEQRPQSNMNGGDARASDDEASPQYRGDKDSYSFSTTSDVEEAAARRQAQKEFDDLVERERGGADQERSSWGRR